MRNIFGFASPAGSGMDNDSSSESGGGGDDIVGPTPSEAEREALAGSSTAAAAHESSAGHRHGTVRYVTGTFASTAKNGYGTPAYCNEDDDGHLIGPCLIVGHANGKSDKVIRLLSPYFREATEENELRLAPAEIINQRYEVIFYYPRGEGDTVAHVVRMDNADSVVKIKKTELSVEAMQELRRAWPKIDPSLTVGASSKEAIIL